MAQSCGLVPGLAAPVVHDAIALIARASVHWSGNYHPEALSRLFGGTRRWRRLRGLASASRDPTGPGEAGVVTTDCKKGAAGRSS
jgi:hypothetical protein